MARMYFGKTLMSPHTVDEREVAKVKFGMSVDNLLGDVDENGNYIAPTEEFVLDLTGVKHVSKYAFAYSFYKSAGLKKVFATDLETVEGSGFYFAFNSCEKLGEAVFGIREITIHDSYAFAYAFSGTSNVSPEFPFLRSVASLNTFQQAFGIIEPSKVFPSLEEITGQSAFADFARGFVDNLALFPKLKKITGSTSIYSSTFYSYSYYTTGIFKFPEVTEITGYVFYSGFAGEIHFAAANQAAIEACEGYANKWGATNATIYFDL